jgi:hypothetical protein
LTGLIPAVFNNASLINTLTCTEMAATLAAEFGAAAVSVYPVAYSLIVEFSVAEVRALTLAFPLVRVQHHGSLATSAGTKCANGSNPCVPFS